MFAENPKLTFLFHFLSIILSIPSTRELLTITDNDHRSRFLLPMVPSVSDSLTFFCKNDTRLFRMKLFNRIILWNQSQRALVTTKTLTISFASMLMLFSSSCHSPPLPHIQNSCLLSQASAPAPKPNLFFIESLLLFLLSLFLVAVSVSCTC